MTDCLFCNIISGTTNTDFIFEDNQLVVFKDINPKAKVHLLLVPRQHIKSLAEVQTEHAALMIHMLTALPKIASMQELHGFRTIINTGRGGGQIIDHIHFHLLGGGNLPKF